MAGSILIASLLLAGQGAPQVQVEPIPIPIDAWKRTAKVEIVATEQDRSATYSGIPLKAVLDTALKGKPEMEALRSLSDAVLIVQGSDGYQAAFSAAAVAMDPSGKKYLLAWERDGKPLAESEGPRG